MPSRDESERALAVVVEGSTRTFLQQVLDAVLAAIKGGRFDEAQPVLALGVMLGWWTDVVGERVVESIKESWQAAYGVTLSGEEVVTARADAMAFHIAAVRDRLSRSALPEIPEAAFDEVRLSQSSAALGGWSTEQQARDIAERLAWEPDKSYWEDQKAHAEDQIDRILDPLGKPGTPARTYAHRHDPAVKVWQAVRAGAVDKIREDQGDWETRATRIARTEATSAWNSGSLAALAYEGRTHKKWLASRDDRTRDSHREADGQVVPLSRPFRVGESLLMMPGDPAAPPWEVINCRCTVVGADEPAKKALTAAAGVDQARVPKGNGEISGRWLDMPGAVLDGLVADPEPYAPALTPADDAAKAAFKEKHGKSIPPSWKDVEVDLDDRASLVARGKDKQGRTVRLYSQGHHDRQAARKFQRLQEVGQAIPKIEAALATIDGDPTKAAARLMFNEGIRVGSTDEQLGKAKAYGATTLRARHATVTPEGVHLSFVAKEGIPVEYDIDDPELVKYITGRLDEAGPDEQLFAGTDSNKTMKFLRDASGVEGIKNHDLRTLLANRIAAALIADMTPPPPETPKAFAALRRRVGEIVSEQLRNKPAQALASYINPAVFAAIREAS
jgi:DNA topoisomerase IB